MAAKGIFNGVLTGQENLVVEGFAKITDLRMYNKDANSSLVVLKVGADYASSVIVYLDTLTSDEIEGFIDEGTEFIIGPGQNLYADIGEPAQVREVYFSVGGIGR